MMWGFRWCYSVMHFNKHQIQACILFPEKFTNLTVYTCVLNHIQFQPVFSPWLPYLCRNGYLNINWILYWFARSYSNSISFLPRYHARLLALNPTAFNCKPDTKQKNNFLSWFQNSELDTKQFACPISFFSFKVTFLFLSQISCQSQMRLPCKTVKFALRNFSTANLCSFLIWEKRSSLSSSLALELNYF